MSRIDLAEEIDASADSSAVWWVIANHSYDKLWRDAVEITATPSGFVQVGTVTAESLRIAGRLWTSAYVITEVSHGFRFDWRTTGDVRARGARSVRPIRDSGCRIRLELTVELEGADRLVAPILGRIVRRRLRSDLARLVELVGAPYVGFPSEWTEHQSREVLTTTHRKALS